MDAKRSIGHVIHARALPILNRNFCSISSLHLVQSLSGSLLYCWNSQNGICPWIVLGAAAIPQHALSLYTEWILLSQDCSCPAEGKAEFWNSMCETHFWRQNRCTCQVSHQNCWCTLMVVIFRYKLSHPSCLLLFSQMLWVNIYLSGVLLAPSAILVGAF